MVNNSTATIVAALFAVLFWIIVIIFLLLLCRHRRKLHSAISPKRKAKRRVYYRGGSQAPVIHDVDDSLSDSSAGDDPDEWDEYDDDEGRGSRVYMNQLQMQSLGAAGGPSFNSLRSENLQLELFNKSFRRSGDMRNSQNYENMPDQLSAPKRQSSVVYQRGKELVRPNDSEPLQEVFAGDVAYENTMLDHVTPTPPPPLADPPSATGPAPPPPTSPPPRMRPQSLTYENPYIDDSVRLPQDGFRPESLTYEDAADIEPPADKQTQLLGEVSAEGRVSIAYEDPTDYSEHTLRKARKGHVESVVYEDLGDDINAPVSMERRRDTITAQL